MRSRSTRSVHGFAALCLAASLLATRTAHADHYDDFHAFALTAFGAHQDSLILDWMGGALDPPLEEWIQPSETSAAIGFRSNLPASSYLEYGPSSSYGSATPTSDRPYSVHLHRLTKLRPNTTYHYRVILVDEQGRQRTDADRTFTTLPPSAALRIPADVAGPPYVLDTPNARYLLTLDLTVPRTAFDITASGVTLDLGGHTVSYDNEPVAVSGPWMNYRDASSFGVRAVGVSRVAVTNGSIRQGYAQSSAHPRNSLGFNPIYVEVSSDIEVSGVTIEYSGNQMVGLFAMYPGTGYRIHHNVFVDRGWQISNRHGMGSKSLGINGSVAGFRTYDNLVKRTRQSALDGAWIANNEIYIDSYATNSFGIPSLVSHREAFGNRIFGTGYHVVGMGWGIHNWWHDNFIQLVGQGPDSRYPEYGNQESLNGIRLTQYNGSTVAYDASVVERNLIVIRGGACSSDGECTQARGLQYSSDHYVTENIIRDNTIRVEMAPAVTQAAAVVTQGLLSRCGTAAPLVYANNSLISNIANVRMGDYYGQGCNHVFQNTTMVRVGSRPDYRTFTFDEPVAVTGQFFFDTTYVGGASPELITFTAPGQEIAFGWTLSVVVTDNATPVEGATVKIEDRWDSLVATGTTDSAGFFRKRTIAYTQRSSGKNAREPVAVTVTTAAKQARRVVPLSGPTTVNVDLSAATGGVVPSPED